MRSYNDSYNIIISYNLIKEHKILLKFMVSGAPENLSQHQRFLFLLMTIHGIDQSNLINLLVVNKLFFGSLENNSSSDFEREMFILIYLVSIGLIK